MVLPVLVTVLVTVVLVIVVWFLPAFKALFGLRPIGLVAHEVIVVVLTVVDFMAVLLADERRCLPRGSIRAAVLLTFGFNDLKASEVFLPFCLLAGLLGPAESCLESSWVTVDNLTFLFSYPRSI